MTLASFLMVPTVVYNSLTAADTEVHAFISRVLHILILPGMLDRLKDHEKLLYKVFQKHGICGPWTGDYRELSTDERSVAFNKLIRIVHGREYASELIELLQLMIPYLLPKIKVKKYDASEISNLEFDLAEYAAELNYSSALASDPYKLELVYLVEEQKNIAMLVGSFEQMEIITERIPFLAPIPLESALMSLPGHFYTEEEAQQGAIQAVAFQTLPIPQFVVAEDPV